ncbi:hypothetical protein O0I10_006629 [Lichtheimia ornata]|uniref:F-box domain-containing protein n=1 Tax=Lichtheimia ornata TaxID=688661 RepID=A0AAD7V2D9_9FUNG|nr:uncharacterized protein O0I10_006629 [Lichtheimia ornata]KAJ8657565.1 hypothetical protein O0I10_006629 [Lichtheimia ornata]
MDDSIWNYLCKQPTLKASSEKYAQLVHDSTTQLHQSLEPILSALNRRAIGLTKCANFESALHDARVMQQLSPFSALGYIREAEIYGEQGKQLEAICVCNIGLSMADTKDTHYDTLQRAKTDAEQRQNTRIDFISQLPLDIVITTLIPMFMDPSYITFSRHNTCLGVSTIWRDRIYRSVDELYFDTALDGAATPCHVIQLAHHLKVLKVVDDNPGTWLCDVLCNNKLYSLRELQIKGSSIACVDDMVSSLKSIGNTLTQLCWYPGSEIALPIHDILHNCPNLVSLDISQQSVCNFNSLPTTSWPNITTLCLADAQETVTSDTVIAISKHFPSLKTLSLQPCLDPQLTSVVLDHYPWMRCVHHNDDEEPADSITYLAEGRQCDDVGITEFSVRLCLPFDNPWTNATPILTKQQRTLECIDFDVKVGDEPEEIYNIEYDRLKKLCLIRSGWWIPRNAPMLEELEISSRTIRGNASVLDTIPPKLKRLALKLHYTRRIRQITAAVSRYLHRFSYHSHLRELVVHCHNWESMYNVIDAIHHLGQLESLEVNCTRKQRSFESHYYPIVRLAHGLPKGCPRLSRLEIIGMMAPPSTGAINALKELEHLEEFAFSIIDTYCKDDFWQALQTLEQLKRLRIYHAKAGNMDGIRRLQGQRPHLKIVVHTCSNSSDCSEDSDSSG